ncbi:MAG: hypothetical protein COA32_16125 [Fluviicola sp.]|nr:MAG: hypothetical protein COA32_16125 [Fluviicola sp.]
MKATTLFPKSYRKIGLVLVVLALLLWTVDLMFGGLSFLQNISVLALYDSGIPFDQTREQNTFFSILEDDFRYEVISVLLLLGLLFFGFSKRESEDELIQKIRLESLLWATYAHFFLFILLTLFTFGLFYLNILVLNVFTILIIYIVRFEFKLFQLKKSLNEE